MFSRDGVEDVGIRVQRQGVEGAEEVVAAAGVEEELVGGGEGGEGGVDRGDEGALDVFRVDVFQASFTGGCGAGGVGGGGFGGPDEVGFAVADLAEEVDEVGGEGGGVES